MTPTEPEKLSDEELKKEVLTQICLIKYGNTPSNLSSEQLAQVAFAASDMYQLITADRKRVALEARLDELVSLRNVEGVTVDAWASPAYQQILNRITELKAQQDGLKS